jgi:hypothetical protein
VNGPSPLLSEHATFQHTSVFPVFLPTTLSNHERLGPRAVRFAIPCSQVCLLFSQILGQACVRGEPTTLSVRLHFSNIGPLQLTRWLRIGFSCNSLSSFHRPRFSRPCCKL